MPLPIFLPLILTPLVFVAAKLSTDKAQKEANEAATSPTIEVAPEPVVEPTPVALASSLPLSASSAADGHEAPLAGDGNRETFWQCGEPRGWLQLTLPELQEVQRVTICEANGSHVQLYAVEYQLTEDGPWRTLFAGDTIGAEKVEEVPPTLTRTVRLHILASDAPPAIAEFSVG